MKRICFLIGICLFPIFSALAEEGEDMANPVEILSFDEEEKMPAINMPDCQDSKLLEQVSNFISAYLDKHPAINIITERKQKLLLKNLHGFTSVPTANFTSQQDYKVANKLIMAKINRGLTDSQIKLCANLIPNRNSNLYMIIYNNFDQIIVEIVNLAQSQDIEQELSFRYWVE